MFVFGIVNISFELLLWTNWLTIGIYEMIIITGFKIIKIILKKYVIVVGG